VERIIRSAIHTYEKHFFAAVVQKLWFQPKGSSISYWVKPENNPVPESQSYFQEFKADPGRIGLESILKEVTKLQYLHELDLPTDLFQGVTPKVLRQYKQNGYRIAPRITSLPSPPATRY